MRVAILCCYPIPYGMAATTRINAYSKGLTIAGDKVDVWSLIPTGNRFNSDTAKDMEIVDSVRYQYVFRRKKANNKLLHIIEIFISYLLLPYKIYNEHKEEQYDVVVASTDNPFALLYFSLIKKIIRCRLLFIFDEYPIPIRKFLKSRLPKWKIQMYQQVLKKYNGYIAMTQNLLNFYQAICNKPGTIVSTIIDTDRFTAPSNHSNINKTTPTFPIKITYLGNMELSKDNVDNIIQAFALSKYKEKCKLYLYGTPTPKDKEMLLSIINQNHLTDKVVFDYVDFKNVATVLKSSHILVSSQPDTVRASGGFPTKLGEYLASGTPVLLTDVGEIGKYFKHNEHLFLSKPNDPIDYANKLDYIIDNYDFAKSIAENGRKEIEQNYSHIIAGLTIHNFIKTL